MNRTKVMNPILKGFNPDPSILRVGKDYYIATSTFEWFPGVRIHHSKDLSNWEVIATPLDCLEHLDLIGNPKSGGVWAPCLSYSEGIYYLIFTNVKYFGDVANYKDSHNYITTATDIKGPWSKPVYLNSSGFDPSLFHDGEKKYYINMEWDYRANDIRGAFTGILLQEFDADTLSLLGEPVRIFNGTELGLTEGPHLYKKDGYYYLLVAEGGTSYEHAMTIQRSKNILGPYEENPNNPLITSYKSDAYLQKSGHGSLVETQDGKWYLSFLCGRPVKDTGKCILGRETGLQEVKWVNGWPQLINTTNNPDSYFEVDGTHEVALDEDIEYTFEDLSFLRHFQTLRIPYDKSIFDIESSKGYLTITGKESLVSTHQQAIICRRQKHFIFEAETQVTFDSTSYQRTAGLIYRYDETNQYYFYMTYDEHLNSMCLGRITIDQNQMLVEKDLIPIKRNTVKLKVVGEYERGQFYYNLGDGWVKAFSEFDTTILSDDYTLPMGFTGAFVGMACQDFVNQTAKARFSYFKYKGQDERKV